MFQRNFSMPKKKKISFELQKGEKPLDGLPFPNPAIEKPGQADQKPSVRVVQPTVRTGLMLALTLQFQAKTVE